MGTFGNSIDQYNVFEQLGKGGFAVVCRATCKNSGQEVAIKIIPSKRTRKNHLMNRVYQEVGIHSRLEHPSILQVYTYFEDEKNIYLVLEYCPNGSLQHYIEKTGLLPVSEACAIMRQVVEGLLYLHKHSIMHRDLTLANLLLTKDMNIKIADFGLATTQKPNEKHMTIAGTPNYIPPETASRGPHGLESDIWALGIILYTCLVGKPPFDTNEGLQATFTKVVMEDIKFPWCVVPEAKNLIKCLLQKNPDDRIKLQNILEHPFFIKYQSSQSRCLTGPLERYRSYDSGVANCLHCDQDQYRCSHSHEPQCAYPATSCSTISRQRSGNYDRIPSKILVPLAPPPPKIPVSPISIRRLRPIRQKTKNVVCSILEDGFVCLEFIKHEKVWEVMRISEDGMRIVMYQPKKGKGVNVSESPPPLPISGADAIFNYENLPEKHWKKYSYAYKFVDLVKSRTPKLTYYSAHAKFYLMENGPVPDFEGCFYQGGKISKSQNRVTVVDHSGKSFGADFFDDTLTFSLDVQFMFEHFKKCWDHCCVLNKTMSDLSENSEEIVFPAIIGRRPQSQNSPLQNSSGNKENVSPQSVFNIPTMRGYETSIASTRMGASTKSKNNQVVKIFDVPGIGRVQEFSNKEIHVNYCDSTKIVMNPNMDGVLFTNAHNQTVTYTDRAKYPPLIHSKLAQLQRIFQQLGHSG